MNPSTSKTKFYRRPLYKLAYQNRTIGYLFGFVILAPTAYFREMEVTSWVLLVLFCFLCPHIFYLLAKYSSNSKQAELRNFLYESLCVGFCVGHMSFSLWITTALVSMACMNNISAGLMMFAKGALALALGMGLAVVTTGFEFIPETDLLTSFLCALSLFSFLMMVGYTIYKKSAVIKEKKIQIELLASKLSKYLSPQIYDSIFEGIRDVKIETNLKKLTVFFSDIVDFTATSESMDLPDLTLWMNSYLNEMAQIALNHGATIDKFIGDGVMIFFGDPESRGEKEDAINCLLMSLEMRDKAKEMGIGIRIGVNTGDCVVGNFGSEHRMDYTIVGAPVNLAARLEASSNDGQILISESTYELVKDQISCEPRGTVQAKGFKELVHTYWALGT